VRRSILGRKSSLMYLCGHPGTGKTSTLHKVLSIVNTNERCEPIFENLEIFLYNAMSFKDVKRYCQKLLADLTERLTGSELNDDIIRDKSVDEDDLAHMIAKVL
jgi:Cdc6-like AAA superfamily ATPase